MPVERRGALEVCLAEAQAVGVRGIGSEPFSVDVKHEENGAIARIRRHKIVRLPRIDCDDGVLLEEPLVVAHIDACRRSADVKDQVPLAMRMHVERAVQLIDRRAAKTAVEDGKRSAHAFPSRRIFYPFLADERRSSWERMQEAVRGWPLSTR